MESAIERLRVTAATANALALRSEQFDLRSETEALPLDLRAWFEPVTLANWVEDVIRKLRAQEPVRTGEIGSMDDSGRTILGMLSFSYLIGIFASSEIARDARMNTPLRLLSGGIFPFRQELSRFRRCHRALMMAVLFEVFVRAASEKLGVRRMRGGRELHEQMVEEASLRLNIACQLDHGD